LHCDTAAFDPCDLADEGLPVPPSVARSVHKRKADFYFGRLAARRALRTLGVVPTEVPIGEQGEPVWPAGVIGSITHSDGLAAAVVCRRGLWRGIGINVERCFTPSRLQEVRARVMNDSEHALLSTHLTLDSTFSWTETARATLLFSAKESLFKAAFSSVGRFFDFSAARVVAIHTDPDHLTLCVNEDLSAEICRGREFTAEFLMLDDDAVLTTCAWQA